MKDIDPEVWRDFKALARLQGLTLKEVFSKFIKAEVAVYRSGWALRMRIDSLIGKPGSKI